MTIDSTLRKAFLQPKSVALVGATPDLKKVNSRPQRFLERFGFKGTVYPINPSREEILGLRAYPDLKSAPGPIDHAFIMVPAPAVPAVIDQCCELSIPVATLFSAGFAELGDEGKARQRAMVEQARAAGLRLLGPNCMGVINVHDRIPLTVNAVIEREELVPGPLSLVSQSGSMTGSILSRAQARGLGFSKIISVGNESDLGVGELADMLVDDEDTGAILLFLETFRDADKLAEAARRAYAAGKPVIAYKLGRSPVGRATATSHTGAMTGPDELATAFFREHGIVRVDTFEGLFETAQLVIGQKPPKGKRVSVVTGTGGAAAMVVDRLGVLGADVVGPSPEVIAKLAGKDIHVSDAPLTDIPMGRSEGGRYSTILSALLSSDHTDAVVSVIGSSAQNPQTIVERVLAASPRDAKPLGVFLAPRADNGLVQLQQSGVASFRTPESCADAVNAYLNWRAPGERPEDKANAASKVAARFSTPRVSEREAGELFAALGIRTADHVVLKTGDEAVEPAGPFAVKLLSPDILHKTEAGMVKLNVSRESAGAEAKRMLQDAKQRYPQARVDGILVQQMERGLAEVIVGYRRDPEIGPVVLLGMGGVTAELIKRIAVRVAPVTLETAREMILEIPELGILRGFRNLPKGDVEALAQAVRAMSLLAAVDTRVVSDAEINPLIVKEEGNGVVAVDGLVVFE
ncbi:MAG TPA: acetate--CoA ligase family protein [Burkholderiales bacterium]|nr:acetate--CoA ligase family protein [Burkholderiales bacterium]